MANMAAEFLFLFLQWLPEVLQKATEGNTKINISITPDKVTFDLKHSLS